MYEIFKSDVTYVFTLEEYKETLEIQMGGDKNKLEKLNDKYSKYGSTHPELDNALGRRVRDFLSMYFDDMKHCTLRANKDNEHYMYTVAGVMDTICMFANMRYEEANKTENMYINLSNILEYAKDCINLFEHNITHLPKKMKSEWLPIVSNKKKIKPVKIYNMESDEMHYEAKIFGGNPDGIGNFEDTPHQFAVALYKAGQERNWVSEQLNVNEDVKIYPTLSDDMKRKYLLGIAQPTTNDSIQTAQISRLIQYISSPVVVCALTRQAYEESLHTQTYSRLIRDIIKDSAIFYLHREFINGKSNPLFSPELYKKNDAVRRMYARLYQTDDPTLEDLLMVLVANQILEEMVFPGAFAFNFAFDSRMVGTISAFEEIAKDETLTHVPLVMNIFRAAVKESCGDNIPAEVRERAKELIIEMTDAEIEWTRFLGEGVPMFTEESVDTFIKNQANSVCRNLNLDLIYPEVKDKPNPLRRMMMSHISAADKTKLRTAIFEHNPTEYTKNNFIDDL